MDRETVEQIKNEALRVVERCEWYLQRHDELFGNFPSECYRTGFLGRESGAVRRSVIEFGYVCRKLI